MKDEQPNTVPSRPGRRPVELRGFALAEGVDADVLVPDLSYEGCQIRSAQRFEPGDKVELRIIGRGGANGEIVWTDEDRAGVRFIA